MVRLLIVVVAVLYAAPALAQSLPVSWTVRLYQAGASSALQTFTVTAAQVSCNQPAPPLPPPPVLNPDTIVWQDVSNAGRYCFFRDDARFDALADGNYEVAATATDATGLTSPESARDPFVRRRPQPPAAPSGVRTIQLGN